MNIIKLQGDWEKRNGIYYEYDVDAPCLGEGGMGRVFKGFRVVERTGERTPVAVKAIYESIPERVVERARREAEIQLENDSLIRMYGFVETYTTVGSVTKVHYHVIMELLVGVTLEDMLKGVTADQFGMQIPFAVEMRANYMQNRDATVVKILKPILSGLMALHDKGFIHRDIDPSNIMLTIEGKIKLIDFGICKQIISLESIDKSLTVSGVFMGKVNYAAPELVLGDVKSQNYTTDIYALGILMYQLCTGHLPFSGTDQEVMSANLRKSLPLKDVKNAGFRKMVKRATEKSQQKRYASVSEMRVDLERVSVTSSGTDGKKIGLYAGIAAAVLILAGVGLRGLLSEKPAPLPDDQELYAQAVNMINYSESMAEGKDLLMKLAEKQYKPAMLKYDSMRIYSADPTEVKDGFDHLLMLNEENGGYMTYFELGLFYSAKGDFEKSIPEMHQKLAGIEADPEKAYDFMLKAMEADPDDYRAVYWALVNKYEIIYRAEESFSPYLKELKGLYDSFKMLYDGEDEEYFSAMLKMGTRLYNCTALDEDPQDEGHL